MNKTRGLNELLARVNYDLCHLAKADPESAFILAAEELLARIDRLEAEKKKAAETPCPVITAPPIPEGYSDLSQFAVSPEYASLGSVLMDAYDQAATGKGRERHARGNPFEKQHMQSISRLLDSPRGMAFQAIKKLTEGLDMKDSGAKERELLGAINYIAGIVVYLRQENNNG